MASIIGKGKMSKKKMTTTKKTSKKGVPFGQKRGKGAKASSY